ncbi:PREDICTED: non-functional pseudokinase ZED1-like [Nelumbo nucifera]|uniref:Non-functional pseudokinase ZED1-like n=1 Tax=Nelumbo nucifera TaxID=4432 RepID=A0A1U8BA76_NELNU|nr:PREDICTED: non-functional pseudokinase ZED1-like [Nelumbo nucifera]
MKYRPFSLLRCFSYQEIKRATNNFAPDAIFKDLRFYKMYRGMHDGRAIAVKKFAERMEKSDQTEEIALDICVSEVAVASQVFKHKNFLKLLGYCLESPIPILVYESSCSNGILRDNIFRKFTSATGRDVISWGQRLRIATQIANAVAFLQTAFPRPIIHPFLHSNFVHLDQNFVPKLSDTGFTFLIPRDKTYVETGSNEDLEHLIAPECLSSRHLTEKSGVYGFGGVLLEILTGKMAIASKEVFGALRCLRYNPDQRPTMTEVAKEIRRIQSLQPS